MKASKISDAPAASAAAIERFNFHGDMLDVVVNEKGEHHVVLARLCDPFHLDTKTQIEKIKSYAWSTWGIFPMVAADGKVREAMCLSLRSVAGWLFTINAGKVAPHLREKLALYQRECADVLADHFLGRRGVTSALGAEQIAQLVAEASARAAELAVAPLLARIASLEAQGGRPCLGTGGARLHVLDPLKEVARIEARAVGKATDERALRGMRMAAEETLRDRLGYPRKGGQSWAFFPQARLGELHGALARLLHDARKRAEIAAPKVTQLRLVQAV
jgi:hypothetical protein